MAFSCQFHIVFTQAPSQRLSYSASKAYMTHAMPRPSQPSADEPNTQANHTNRATKCSAALTCREPASLERQVRKKVELHWRSDCYCVRARVCLCGPTAFRDHGLLSRVSPGDSDHLSNQESFVNRCAGNCDCLTFKHTQLDLLESVVCSA